MSLLDVKRKRDVRRQRGQFIAVAVTIGLGVMLFAATYDAYRNLDASYNATYDRLDFADITVVGAVADFDERAATIDGVASVERRFQADIPMRIDGDMFLGRIVAYPPDRQPEVNKISIVDGDGLDPDDPAAVVLESATARTFDIGVDDSVDILVAGSWGEAHVAGVADSAEYIWPARDSQNIFPPPGTFGIVFVSDDLFATVPPEAASPDVLITYEEGVDIETVDDRVTQAAFAAGAGHVVPRAEHPSHSTLLLDVDGFRSMAVMFPSMFMLAAGMAAFVLLTRVVYAQRSQIGTLRASGMHRKIILRHYLSYGVRLGLVAGLVGLAVGMLAGFLITGVYTDALGIPDTVRTFHFVTPIIGLLFGLAAGGLGAWAPARIAFRLSPAEAMRGEVPAEQGRRSLVERMLPPLRRLPVRWLMVMRGIGRSKRRSLSTVLGVVLAVTLVMVSWGMLDTMIGMIDRQFNEVATEDADVVLLTPLSDDAVTAVEQIGAVEHVEVVSTLEATVERDGRSFSTSLLGFTPDSEVHEFPDGLPAAGVLAGSGLADHVGASVGDELRVQLPGLDREFTTTLVGFLDEPVGTFLYADRDRLEEVVGAETLASPSLSSLKIRFADGVSDRDAVVDEIEDLEPVGIVIDSRALYELVQDFLGFFYAFIGMMVIFGGAMAFALMYNTISVNVAERSGEFATMRANGLSHARIARLIGTENILLTVLGIAPGLIVGYVVGGFFMSQFSVDAFTMKFQMRPLSMVLIALAMVAVAMLSLIPAIRTVERLDIAQVVRERAA